MPITAPLSDKLRLAITLLLLGLTALDVALWITTTFAPAFWFATVHGVEPIETQGLLARTGAIWLAFALFQFIAFLRWKKDPWWLVFVAGMRLSELVADWVYLGFGTDFTTLGRVVTLTTPVLNLAVAVLLVKVYLALRAAPGQT